MYETKRTLIVVYKDELLMNQLRKMVESNDDTEDEIVGTKDDSVNIVSWTEQVWLDNKKAGNIQGKILFLGEVKDTAKLIPVIDVKFNDCGVKYGWAGNQAIVYADPQILSKKEDYDAFLDKLEEQPVPKFLKQKGPNLLLDLNKVNVRQVDEDRLEKRNTTRKAAREAMEQRLADAKIIQAAKDVHVPGSKAVKKIGNEVADRSEEMFRNKPMMKRQMLFYGIVNLYNKELENFLNS